MSTVAFIVNGRLRQLPQLRQQLSSAFPGAHFLQTASPNHATALTVEAVRDGARYIISVGGDGVLNEVVNGYMECDAAQRQQSTLGIFPAGSGNDFCKTVQIRADVRQLKDLLENDQSTATDVCLLSTANAVRYFINIADIGLGGHVVQRVNRSRKRFGAKATFASAILRTFITYRKRTMRLVTSNFEWEDKALMIVVANGKYFGKGLGIAPNAMINDGKLEVVVFGNVSLWDYLRRQGKIRRCQIVQHPEVHYQQSTECAIEAPKDCPIEADGESIGFGSLRVKVLSGAVRLLAPSASPANALSL